MAGRKQLSADEILDILMNGDTSDLEISDDEDKSDEPENFNEQQIQQDTEAETVSPNSGGDDDDDDATGTTGDRTHGRRHFWRKTDRFHGFDVVPPVIDHSPEERENWASHDYVHEYFDNDFVIKMTELTNMRVVQDTGKAFNLTEREMNTFIGSTVLMSCLRYPRIRMYWAKTTRVPSIANKITRSRYFSIRSTLKVVNDNLVTEEEKRKDKLWKIRPIMERVRNGCLRLQRGSDVAIDEQMIPFTGVCGIKQFVRGKPNPEGLKNFVLALPCGLVLDFEVYQGKGTFPEPTAHGSGLGIGGSAVLRLCETLTGGTHVYFDRYFTSLPLLETLFSRNLPCTGTIMKSRIPAAVHLTDDKMMMKLPRGSSDQSVREDGKLCIVKWYDQKPVLLASTKLGIEPQDNCRRWSKKEKKYITVPRPAAVSLYNSNMGGIDLIDRIISYYRISSRTKKWTVRCIFHFIDLAIANSWVQYRMDKVALGEPRRNIMQFHDFKIQIAEYFLAQGEESSNSEESETEIPAKRHRDNDGSVGTPCRKKKKHLPIMTDVKNSVRCKNPQCTKKTKVMCQKCEKYLCLTGQNNCFLEYHQN